jgi:predicted Ser/Thr protein kinase
MNSNFKYKLHIHTQNIELLYNDTNTIDKTIRGVREVRVLTNKGVFVMMVDERFNELDFIYDERPNDPFNHVKEYLKQKYNELKSTDFRYKSGDGYEGSKTIHLENFITYLKSENRETIINNILC